MQEQSTPDPPEDDRIERAVFMLLTDCSEQRPWSVRELELELGDPVDVADSLCHLQGAGLVHRCGDFVWATRAALYAERVSM